MPSTAASIHYSRTCAHLGLAAILIGLLTAIPNMVQAQEPLPAQQSAPPAETVAPTVPPAPGAAPQAATPAGTAPDTETPATDTAPPAASPPLNSVAPEGTIRAEDAAPSTAPSTDSSPAVDEPAADVPAMLQNLLPAGERADIPHDLSPWGMFMAADWVVKGVMLGLAFASLVTWTVWLAKTLELAGARARAGRTLKIIRNSATLAEAVGETGQRGGPAALMLRSAAEEVRLSEAALDHADNAGVKERVSSALGRIESAAGRRMSRGTGALATIGSTAPFVGLFGTVWGIMNAFIGISEAQTTNLAVVAPGIAEALLATAIGLVAAIPAVVIYNVFARSITGYRQLLADAAAGVERLVSRDLDFRKVPPGGRKAPVSLVAGE
ncbi:tonB-system energizer ExbB [Rhizobium halophilum]|uniref:tonB-system energizer ExbB n=1 Tax=Rhizobium halophilum TaxID=2846852 RepID=UPI00374CD53D